MITVSNLSYTAGTKVLFDGVSFTLLAGQQIGVVGRNGAGKSTLLKLLGGHLTPDEGSIAIEKNKKIAYMPQEVTLLSTRNVFDEAFNTFAHIMRMEEMLITIEQELQHENVDHEALIEEYTTLQEELRSFDKSAALAKTEYILNGLGFSQTMQKKPVAELSVGWKMRLVLAQLLLQDADFYFFDEPTNHLDIVTAQWFFDFLKKAAFGFLLVSHDRYYLDHACTTILDVHLGKCTMYSGNFSSYIAQKEQQHAIAQTTYDNQQRDIAKKLAAVNRFKASASRATWAQSVLKQIDKIELVEIEPPLPTMSITFPPFVQPGSVVLQVKNLKKEFDSRTIFSDVSFDIQRGEKVAVIAANGKGKTTLFSIISAKIPPTSGSILWGHNVQTAVFEQDQLRALNPENSIFDEVCQACPFIVQTTIRTFLGAFLFSGDDVYKKISALSGGERNRVAMIKVLLQKANVLLLDEPTNHLDLYAKQALLNALQTYQGTILFVSHDQNFIENLATRIIELTEDGVISYPGTYREYVEHKKEIERSATQTVVQKHPKKTSSVSEKKAPAPHAKDVAKKEMAIMKLEKKLELMSEEFARITYGSPPYAQHEKEYARLQKEHACLLAEWEKMVNQ